MKFSIACAVVSSAIMVGTAAGLRADHHESLKVGDKVPEFTAIDQDGDLWKASDYLGKKNLVIYFYPAAMTGGCTKQACSFRDDAQKLSDVDAVVVGVSGDVPSGLKVFQKSHDLNFDLLSDYDGKIARIFGVPTRDGGSLERQFEGKPVKLERGLTASRWTFVVGKDGQVTYKDTQVDATKDSENIVSFLKSK